MIVIKNRELMIPNYERYIGTTYDLNSETRIFRMSRFNPAGIDLSDLSFQLNGVMDGDTDNVMRDQLSKEVSDTYITLTWEISEQFLSTAGTIFISVSGIDTNGTVRWNSFPAPVYTETGMAEDVDNAYRSTVAEVNAARGSYDTLAERLSVQDQALNEEIETRANNDVSLDNKIIVERNRIDQFTNLDAGSTTGDAELMDARISTNGVTYTNAGAAIRSQAASANDDLERLYNDGNIKFKLAWESGSLNASGEETASEAWVRTDYIELAAMDGVTIYNNFTNARYIYRYDSEKAFVSRVSISAGGKYTLNASSWSNTSYIRLATTKETLDLLVPVRKSNIATSQDLGHNGPYVVEPVAGITLSFQKGSSNELTVDISAVSGNALYVVDPSGNRKALPLSNYDFPYTVANGTILVYDIENDVIVPYPSSTEIDLPGAYVILLTNHYGRVKGYWHKFYLEQKISEIGNVGYPSYYADHMETKLETIKGHEMSVGAHGDSFIFVTDTHWNKNSGNSPALIKALLSRTMTNKVIHGGDVPVAYETVEQMYADVMNERAAFKDAVGDHLFRLLGNHDIHSTVSGTTDKTTLTPDQVYGLLMKDQENRVSYNPDDLDGSYFYFDNPAQKIRYICLNNFEDPYVTPAYMSNAQITWLIDVALNLSGAWNIVFIGHCGIISDYTVNYSVFADLLGVMEALANKTSFTTSFSKTCNFASSQLKVVAYFFGHHHRDDIVTKNGVKHVCTTCDARFTDDGKVRTQGTVNEQAFDVIHIDTDAQVVYMTRIGAGDNRSFTF